MTKRSLTAEQSRLLEMIEGLGFGRIEQLSIQDGAPRYERPPRIIEEIKLGSGVPQRYDNSNADQMLKKEFACLFDHLARLRDGAVDIEVRHALPFRLVLERRYKDLP